MEIIEVGTPCSVSKSFETLYHLLKDSFGPALLWAHLLQLKVLGQLVIPAQVGADELGLCGDF